MQEALLMLMVKTGSWVGKLLLVGFLVAGLAGPALAGNVWSWVTEDGTYAFTDDPKRIPARNRGDAEKRSMGKLTRYERYIEISSGVEKPYAERIRERRNELREREAVAPIGVIAGAAPTPGVGAVYGIPATGGRGRAGSGASIMVPLAGGQAAPDAEPTTIESIRVKPANSQATRHWTVVKQGDRITTVIKGELRQRPLRPPSESDFDL
jgi:hypothetical protein